MRIRLVAFFFLALVALIAGAPPASGGQVRHVASAQALQEALSTARGGDVILLAPGEYRGYFAANNLHGSEQQPTVIGAADPARPPLLRGLKECLHVSRASHLIVRDLRLEGATVNGLNIDDGDDADPADSASRYIVVENVTVRDVGPRGNRDGIKLSGIDDFLVVGCTVERWGSLGSAIDMVGCHRGLIADCTFRNDVGRGLTGVQMKGGTRNVCVTRSRFHEAGLRAVNMGGNTGIPYFRPLSPGYEARDLLTIGNVFVGSKAAVAFVGSESCEASYNTIVHPTRWALRILQESRGRNFAPCRNGLFRRNVVVWRYRELLTTANIGPATDPASFRFQANWWYCDDRPARSTPFLPTPEPDGTVGRDPRLRQADAAVQATADHGASAPAAAREFARLARPMASWAFAALADRRK